MRRCIWLAGVLMVLISAGVPQVGLASDLSEVLFTKGLMFYDQGRYDMAVQNLREAIREDPANLEIRKYLHQAEAKAAGKPSPIAFYEEAVKKEPGSARAHLNLAAALSMEGQNDRAVASIEEAGRLAPGNGEVLFFRGLIRLKKGAYREAVGDFQQARGLEPRLAQGAMFYEATALMRLQERQTALGLFQNVVAANPTTDYAAEAAQQSRTEVARRFSAQLTTGGEYDTNVTQIGRHSFFGGPTNSPDRFEFRVPFSSLMDYRFWDVGEWSFGGRYGFYASVHDETSLMNVVSNQAELYGVWRSGDWYMRPYYYFQSVFLGGDQLSDTHTLGTNLMYYTPYNLAPELVIKGQSREYHGPSTHADDPDGWNLRGEFNLYYLLKGGRGYFRGGVGMEGNQTSGDNQDYTAFVVLAGLQYQLPWELLFNFDFEYQRRPYTNVSTVYGIKREDDQYSFGWQLSKPIGYGFEVKGRITYLRNDSNISDFDYDRQVYSLLFSWNY